MRDGSIGLGVMKMRKLVLSNMVVGVFRVGTLDLYRIAIVTRAGLKSGFSVDITLTKKDFDALVNLLNEFREGGDE